MNESKPSSGWNESKPNSGWNESKPSFPMNVDEAMAKIEKRRSTTHNLNRAGICFIRTGIFTAE